MSNTTVVTAPSKGEHGKEQEKGGKVAVKQEEASSTSTQQQQQRQQQQQQATRSPKTIYLISKTREIHHHFQNSVFYVRSTKEVPDVVRYSDRLRPPPSIDAGAVLSHCLGGRKRTRCGVFVPEELVGGQRRIRGWDGSGTGGEDGVGGKGGGKKGLNLAELAAKIRKEGGLDVEENEGEGQEDEEGGVYEDEGEESEGEDYVTNYYESEGEESKGSDGEPTF